MDNQKNPDLTKALRKAKRRQSVKMILISVVTVLVLLPAGYVLCNKLSERHSNELNDFLFVRNAIAEPNVSIDSQVLVNSSPIGGSVVSNRSKNIAGYVVPWDTLTNHYTMFRSKFDYNEMHGGWHITKENLYFYNRQTKQLLAQFYHPNIKNYYDGWSEEDDIDLPQDLQKMSGDTAEVSEVALSFDQPYLWSEVKKQFPDDVNVVWLYLLSDDTLDESSGPQGTEVLGFQAYNRETEDLTTSFEGFLKNLEHYNGGKNQPMIGDFIKNYEGFLEKNHKKTFDEVEILGVMITGQNKHLKKLEKLPFVRTSSIGVTAEMSPYIIPEKQGE
ncbi:sigma factor regulator N-terminal domain-containing protein [Vagococcus elongatus]|nr:anti sigma factor C-terminal domain-containing protein [Vagococcus elongatus]